MIILTLREDGLLIVGAEAELRGCNSATTVVVKHERMLEVNELYSNTRRMYSTFLQANLKGLRILQDSRY